VRNLVSTKWRTTAFFFVEFVVCSEEMFIQQQVDSPDRFRKWIHINRDESVKCVRGDFRQSVVL
jgi:hypothetical protein